MSAINDLIDQIENSELRLRIQQEVAKMSKQRKFGLVFEDHVPENIPLYELPIRRGLRVAKRDGDIRDNYQVLSLKDGIAECEHLDEETLFYKLIGWMDNLYQEIKDEVSSLV